MSQTAIWLMDFITPLTSRYAGALKFTRLAWSEAEDAVVELRLMLADA
jgi:hypothetical protein